MKLEDFKIINIEIIHALIKTKQITLSEALIFIKEHPGFVDDDTIDSLFDRFYSYTRISDGITDEALEVILSDKELKYLFITNILSEVSLNNSTMKVLFTDRDYLLQNKNLFIPSTIENLISDRYVSEDRKSVFLKFLFDIDNPLFRKRLVEMIREKPLKEPGIIYAIYLFKDIHPVAKLSFKALFDTILDPSTKRAFNTRVLTNGFTTINTYVNDSSFCTNMIQDAYKSGIINDSKDYVRLKSCLVDSDI